MQKHTALISSAMREFAWQQLGVQSNRNTRIVPLPTHNTGLSKVAIANCGGAFIFRDAYGRL